jgi:drug/metabolite transporter (DMT)-like permease
MFFFFLALGLLPLADAIALGMSGPIFLTALSVPLLRERVGIRRWSAVFAGFVGVLIMVRPGSGVLELKALTAIAGAFFYALAMVSIRRLSRSEPAGAIVFYFTLFAMAAGLATLPLAALLPGWIDPWVWPDAAGWTILVGIGLLGGTAQLTLTYAFKLAPVAVIAPFEYGSLVFGVLFGLLIWREAPDRYILIGAAVVIASGLYILYRETKLRRLVRSPQPPV